MQAAELCKLSVEELRKKLSESRKELFNLRFQHSTSQLESTAGLPKARKAVARILTVLKDKERGA